MDVISRSHSRDICWASPTRGVGFMTSNETAAAVRALLESYRDAFERLGAAAIAVTTLVVAALARPELLIEIDVTAASAN